MKKITSILIAVVMLFSALLLVSCNNETVVVVRLHPNNGDPTRVYQYSESKGLPTNYTNGDKEFGGWYLDEQFNQPVTKATELTDGMDLYAKWTQAGSGVSNKITLRLDPNYAGANVVTMELDKNTTFSLPTHSRTGYTFAGWWTDPADGNGFEWKNEYPFSADTTLYAHWTQNGGGTVPTHTHNFGDNYFMYVECSVEGCDVIGRKESTNPFRNDFTYSFTQADRTAMDNAYATLSNQIKGGSVSVQTIIDGIEDFEALNDNISYQYQVATVLFSVNYNDEWEEKATLISEAYYDWFQQYFTLFGLINESSYKDEFFADWNEEDIEYVLEQAEIYSASEDNLQNKADELANEYNNLFNSIESEDEIPQLYEAYGKYVAANNAIAAQYGNKYANFMDYSYANDYGREYTPAQVATMREYVRTKIAPLLIELYNKYNEMEGFFDDNYNFYDGMEDDYNLYEALIIDSLFTLDDGYEQGTYDATNYIGNFFKYLNNNQSGSREINFYNEVNKLFQNGNYFTSSDGEEGAYTYFIENKNTPIMYFDDSADWYGCYYYSTAFTFVHEFGHYYADIYTNGGNFSMDHAETHSQGDEMMFLAWLKDNCPKGTEYGYQVIQIEQLVNILQTIVQATIVDEFEQAVYSNTYGNGDFKDGIESSQYGELYKAIVESYGDGMLEILGEEYWLYVVVDSSAYYISYAMSALPSLEIYVKAMTDGLDEARNTYFKLFTCINSQSELTYSEALTYAGLDSPFSESLFATIENYLNTLA